jgi:hypothetical protein
MRSIARFHVTAGRRKGHRKDAKGQRCLVSHPGAGSITGHETTQRLSYEEPPCSCLCVFAVHSSAPRLRWAWGGSLVLNSCARHDRARARMGRPPVAPTPPSFLCVSLPLRFKAAGSAPLDMGFIAHSLPQGRQRSQGRRCLSPCRSVPASSNTSSSVLSVSSVVQCFPALIGAFSVFDLSNPPYDSVT